MIEDPLAVLFTTAVVASLSLVGGCAATEPAPRVAAKPSAPAPLVQRFASEPAPTPGFPDPDRGQKLRAAAADVGALARRTAQQERLPALALGVVIDDELAIREVIGVRDVALGGEVDEHTRFRLGSITKPLTAAAVLRLRDEGRLAIDAPAARYLPALAGVVYPTRDSRPMTVRDLLTHSAGLPRLGVFSPASTARDVTEREILSTLDGFGLESAPGTETSYSNLGYSLLGLLVGRAAGVPYRRYVSEALLAPLGMRDAAWDAAQVPAGSLASPHVRAGDAVTPIAPWRLGASEAAAGLYASLADMGRFVGFQLAAWPARDAPDAGVLRRSTVRESHMMARNGSAFPASGGSDGPGLGWQVREDCDLGHVVFHNGLIDGFSASVVLLPRRGVGVVALANVAGADLESLNKKVLGKLEATGAMVARVVPPSPSVRRAAQAVAAVIGRARTDVLDRRLRPGWFSEAHLGALRQELRDIGERMGACALDGSAMVESATSARFGLRCQRGALSVAVRVDTSSDPRITSLNVEEQTGSSALENVRRRARPAHCR
ncbi:serine hydrolase [Sorangium cellulosum]|uniref:Serine hydrolase n=1 Tax=Sorangium cellulosum TaxID=56 RepID=A0A4V0ND78_SORCE|nr:serine hydrolase domain-containing protein [Sorangium cellulosum]AUX21722.1 serine hydrolase [Sorangium cellulosum]